VFYQDLLSGLVELHVLYHAAQEDIFGLGMLEELKRHGYRISPGHAPIRSRGAATFACWSLI